MKIIILEKNVPIPAREPERDEWPFYKMQIGESFFLPYEQWTRARIAAYVYAGRHGMKFSARKVEGGGRIWRIR